MLVAHSRGPKTNISPNLVGPRRIKRIMSACTVELEQFLDKSASIVHVCSIRPYADSKIETPIHMKDAAERMDII